MTNIVLVNMVKIYILKWQFKMTQKHQVTQYIKHDFLSKTAKSGYAI